MNNFNERLKISSPGGFYRGEKIRETYDPSGVIFTRRNELISNNNLIMAGINVSFVDSIPSRYAVIDKEILWYGSMNLVSNIKEDDDEMRIVNRNVAKALI